MTTFDGVLFDPPIEDVLCADAAVVRGAGHPATFDGVLYDTPIEDVLQAHEVVTRGAGRPATFDGVLVGLEVPIPPPDAAATSPRSGILLGVTTANPYDFIPTPVLPVPPNAEVTAIDGPVDTIRGGKAITVFSVKPLNTKYDEANLLHPTSLPTGWALASGAKKSTKAGLELKASRTAGTVAQVTTPSTSHYFDTRVTAQVLEATDQTTGYVAELRIVSGVFTAKVGLFRSTDGLIALCEVTGGSTAESGVGEEFVTPYPAVELRAVANGDQLFLLVNGVQLHACRLAGFSTGGKTTSLVTQNDASVASTARTRYTNYVVRSAATISNRLVEGLTYNHDREIEGFVPAAALAELGPVPVSAFGPWGTLTNATGFTYTLPRPLDFVAPGRTLRTITDKVVRGDDE